MIAGRAAEGRPLFEFLTDLLYNGNFASSEYFMEFGTLMKNSTKVFSLQILPDRMAICRLAPTAPVPDWIEGSRFCSVTRTDEALTVVGSEALVPAGTLNEPGWWCFKVQGPLDFSEIGIIFSLTRPLADNDISVFVISTFDTDFFMVKETDLAKAIDALTAAGHRIVKEDGVLRTED